MVQRDLNRAVARATGETIETVQRRGFRLWRPDRPREPEDEDLGPTVLDWDRRQAVPLSELLPDDDWPRRRAPLPSHDEDDEIEDDHPVPRAA